MNFTDHTSTMVTAVLSFFIPALAAWLRGRRASSGFAGTLVMIVCFLGALASMLLTDTLLADVPTHDARLLAKLILENFFTAMIGAITFYSLFYKPQGIADRLEKIGPQLGNGTGPTPGTDTSFKPPIA